MNFTCANVPSTHLPPGPPTLLPCCACVGFFWNVALVAGAAIIVLAAVSTRVQRAKIKAYRDLEEALELKSGAGKRAEGTL